MRVVTPTGTQLNTENWQIEAALRLLCNNLDPAVAEDPDNLIVYGGRGKAARNNKCLEQIVTSLKNLKADENNIDEIGSPLQGLLYKVLVKKGQEIKENPNSIFALLLVSEMLNQKQLNAREASDLVANFSPKIGSTEVKKMGVSSRPKMFITSGV